MRPEPITPGAGRPPIARVVLAAAVGALGLAACGMAATGEEQSTTSNEARPAGLSEAVAQSEATRSKADVGPVRAIRIATAAVNGGRVFGMELDRGLALADAEFASTAARELAARTLAAASASHAVGGHRLRSLDAGSGR